MALKRNRDYLQGALAAREFLRRTQAGLKLHRQFEPRVFRWEFQSYACEKSAEYHVGFFGWDWGVSAHHAGGVAGGVVSVGVVGGVGAGAG